MCGGRRIVGVCRDVVLLYKPHHTTIDNDMSTNTTTTTTTTHHNGNGHYDYGHRLLPLVILSGPHVSIHRRGVCVYIYIVTCIRYIITYGLAVCYLIV